MRSLLSRLPTPRAFTALPSSSSSSSSSSSTLPRRCSYSSSAGRSSSRDGGERTKPTQAPKPSTSTSSSRPVSTTAPTRPCAPSAPQAPSRQPVVTRAGVRDRFVLLHANGDLVGLDSFFATHRPLLELPVRLINRRSTLVPLSNAQPAEVVEMSLERELASSHGPLTVQVEEGQFGKEMAKVVDLAEDGTPMGAPYLVRLDGVEPLRSVEEEIAAEEKEEAALQLKVERLHAQEAESVEPYDAWMIGQHQVQPAPIARYLAVHPPFTAPSGEISPSLPTPSPSASTSQITAHLAYLSPFTSSSSTPLSPLFSPAFPAFVDHFVAPLEPQESSALADQFLSSAQMKQGWAARSEYVRSAGEALRQASQLYSGVSKETQEKFPLPHAKEEVELQRGEIRIWDETSGWKSVNIGQNEWSDSPFLPAEMVEIDERFISLDSVKRKRKKAMLKHKYRKRRKAQRALRQRLGK